MVVAATAVVDMKAIEEIVKQLLEPINTEFRMVQEGAKFDLENKFEKVNRQIDNLEDRVGEHEIRLASSEAVLNNMNYQINQKISI